MENLAIIQQQLWQGVFQNASVFVTGDTGFKGSWLVHVLSMLGAKVYGYALPVKSSADNFARNGYNSIIQHQDGNILDQQKLEEALQNAKPDFIFHLAAQSLVLDSFTDPYGTFETNIMGSIRVYEAARKINFKGVLINVTSDKCYHNQEWEWGYRENDPMGGKDPYSASKGALELVAQAYHLSFFKKEGIRMASVRAGNVIGGGDRADNRIIPDAIRAWEKNESLSVRNPRSTRPWQFVLEPLFGYLTVAAALKQGKAAEGGWNFGPMEQKQYSVADVAQGLYDALGGGSWTDASDPNSPPEANYLKLDISKASARLNWHPVLSFQDTMKFTAQGYLDEQMASNDVELRHFREQQILEYIGRFMKANPDLCRL